MACFMSVFIIDGLLINGSCLSLLTTGRNLPNPDGTFLPPSKKSLLCYGLSLETPETSFGLLDQFQIQLVNEQLQCWIAPYHLLEYLTLCRDGQKEVRYVQTVAALFVGGQAFQHIGYNHSFAGVGQQGGVSPAIAPLPPDRDPEERILPSG